MDSPKSVMVIYGPADSEKKRRLLMEDALEDLVHAHGGYDEVVDGLERGREEVHVGAGGEVLEDRP